MKFKKRFIAIAFTLLAGLFSLSAEPLYAGPASPAFAAAQTAKQQCMDVCQARYRACFSLKQIPSSECRGVYQDCTRFTCNALKG